MGTIVAVVTLASAQGHATDARRAMTGQALALTLAAATGTPAWFWLSWPEALPQSMSGSVRGSMEQRSLHQLAEKETDSKELLPARPAQPRSRHGTALRRPATLAMVRAPAPMTSPVQTEGVWRDQHRGRIALAERTHDHPWAAHLAHVQCGICTESAESFEAGQSAIERQPDLRNLTTVTVGDTTIKVTNLQPFSFFVRQKF